MSRFVPPWLLALLVLLTVGAWIASGYVVRGEGREEAGGNPPSTQPMAVEVDEPESRRITRELVLQGQSRAERRVTVRAEVAGRVRELPEAKGARVEVDTVLARLAMNDRQARLREARALVAQREEEAEAAQRLGDSGFQSRTQIRGAEAALEAARARLAAIEEEIENTRVRAPFAGILDGLPVEEGDYLTPGSAVAELVDLDPLLVVVNVPQRDIESLREAGEVGVRFATGASRQGRVGFVAASADEDTRTFRVEIAVPNEEGAIPAGVSATARVPVGATAAHFLSPAVLVLNDDGELGVKGVDDDGVVVFHPVEVVRAEREGFWVAGLPQGVRVITVGQGFVREGEEVRVVAAEDSPLGQR
ncbi:efflux RND transporter periplasmic adaptor subunit [Arhodomonas sp. SL1]|uniref:efflux RND transporter periplasmic adaptor subunit n=1 Tax=Arhodomonas sp. SL1 TaxID=3425691 RepID=UPI003F881D6C